MNLQELRQQARRAHQAGDLPLAAQDYVDNYAGPYFAAVSEWYASLRIGTPGGDLAQLIDEHLSFERYGIFLNHILVAALLEEYFPQLRARIVGAIVTVVISFVTADISYRLVEKPAIKFRRQFRSL